MELILCKHWIELYILNYTSLLSYLHIHFDVVDKTIIPASNIGYITQIRLFYTYIKIIDCKAAYFQSYKEIVVFGLRYRLLVTFTS
jgi:hypothetical protein